MEDIEHRVLDAERRLNKAASELRYVIGLLDDGDIGFLVAERLAAKLNVIEDELHRLLSASETDGKEGAALAALLLLKKGDETGVPILIEEIERSGDSVIQAIRALSKVWPPGIRELLLRGLEQTSIKDEGLIAAFVDGLRALNIKVPAKEVQRLSTADAPFSVRVLFEGNQESK